MGKFDLKKKVALNYNELSEALLELDSIERLLSGLNHHINHNSGNITFSKEEDREFYNNVSTHINILSAALKNTKNLLKNNQEQARELVKIMKGSTEWQ